MCGELKAFTVQEDHEGTGDIYFAKHAIVALRRGANDLGDGDISSYKARRTPWADQYAPGPVPRLALIDHGWWHDCHGCEVRINSDNEGYDVPDGEMPRELSPVEDDRGLFCTAACRDAYLLERMEKKIFDQWMSDLMRLELAARLPGVTAVEGEGMFAGPYIYAERVDGLWRLVEASIAFTFPGSVHGTGHLRIVKGKSGFHASICHGDMEAWTAWRAAQAAAS